MHKSSGAQVLVGVRESSSLLIHLLVRSAGRGAQAALARDGPEQHHRSPRRRAVRVPQRRPQLPEANRAQAVHAVYVGQRLRHRTRRGKLSPTNTDNWALWLVMALNRTDTWH